MAIWTNSGVLKIDGSGKVITCATCPCSTDPCGMPDDEIQANLGAGGWADAAHNLCNEVAGIYVLAKLPAYDVDTETYCERRYGYSDCIYGTLTCGGELRCVAFSIIAIVTHYFSGDTYDFAMYVTITGRPTVNDEDSRCCTGIGFDDSGTTSQAIYAGTGVAANGGNLYTLSKSSDNHQSLGGSCTGGTTLCTGTLPSTAKLDW